jgi:dihydroorotase (homodimeric type)
VKLYPAGATTNSDAGLTDIAKAYATLAEMERVGLPLLVHGEVTDPAIDLFDREKVFIDTVLAPLTQRFPQLKVVMEHITTRDAAEFVASTPANVAATITVHHLLYNRNAIFQGGVRPHWYCLPVLKRETHREALVAAAISGSPKFFLGTDSAPHAKVPRKRPAAVPAATPPTPPSSCTPKPSNRPARSTSWKVSPASTARTGTACRAIPTPSRWPRKAGRCRPITRT